MKQYTVTGMSCAACSARVEKAVSQVPGVKSCSVSLLTNSMGVEGAASESDIIHAVEEAGYGAMSKEASPAAASSASREEEALRDHETPKLKKRLFSSLGFLLVLMYISMGHMIGLPLPAFLQGNHVGHGLAQMLLAAIRMRHSDRLPACGAKPTGDPRLQHVGQRHQRARRSGNMETALSAAARQL